MPKEKTDKSEALQVKNKENVLLLPYIHLSIYFIHLFAYFHDPSAYAFIRI